MLGVFVSMDLFLFFVFWETDAGSYVPAHRHLGRPAQAYAAIKFFLYTLGVAW